MSILIKGMEMPKNCWSCPFHDDVDDCILLNQSCMKVWGETKRLDDCPLVEIVHCKDCAYMERGVKDSNEVWCCWHDSRMMEDDFCSRGRRANDV